MEKTRHRKSRSASGIIEGSRLVQKQIATPKLASDSRSYCNGASREDMIMFDLGKSSSKRVTGTPMKKLVADEMSKEGESKRRQPSVIAKLMGLDGMPSPQHLGRQQRRLSDSCEYRNEQIDSRRRRQLFDEQSSRRSSMEQQEFKDVYEDLEASHVANRRHSSRWSQISRLAKPMPEMALIQQKFMDAKRLSTDARFQNSKEFDDTLEALESNKELLLKYLQEPDSLFVKHLQDLQVDTASSKCSQIAVLKPSNSVMYQGSAKSWKSGRGGSYEHDINLQKEREDGLLLQSQRRHCGHNSQKTSQGLLEGKEENITPTRIVILKPNLGITQTDITSVSYRPDVRNHARRPCASPGGAGSEEEKRSSKNMGISRPKSKEAREIAKEITMRMRDTFGTFDGGPRHFRSSGVRGYAGDESSCDVYETDSTSESDIATSSSRKLFDGGNRKKYSSPGSSESSVSREAKQRLSERWKMTQHYQDFDMVGKSSTLGEMLSLPDGETKPELWDTMVHIQEPTNEYVSRKGTTEWDCPLGISSSDGWKDGCISTSSRFRSTPPPLGRQKHRSKGRHEVYSNKRYSTRKEPVNNEQSVNHYRSRSLDGRLNLEEEFFSRESRSNRNKFHACHLGSNSSPKDKLSQTIDTDLEDNLSETLPSASQISAADGKINGNAVEDAETESVSLSSEYSIEMLQKISSGSGDASSLNQVVSNLQEPSLISPEAASVLLECPAPEPELSVSSTEADHPSPVSVLEAPFTEDGSSGSECFERVNAELNGLRMQLQLLRMESESYANIAISDEEVEGPSAEVFEDICSLRSQSWQSSYTLDVLTDSGLKASDPDTFVTSCHSLECPLSPWVFDNLEKKYTDETSGPRYERRLLFDRINFCLLEILRKYVDPCPWVKPMEGLNWKWKKYGMKNTLHQLLRSQESAENADTPAIIVDREMHWLELKDDIDLIGKEIEKLLIEELIIEVVTM